MNVTWKEVTFVGKPLKLQVEACKRIGYCYGIRRAIKLVIKAIFFSRWGGLTLYYKEPPHEAKQMIAKFGIWVKEWRENIPGGAIEIISPYGAGPDAYKHHCIDGTCPNVASLRQKVIAIDKEGYQLVLMADENSSEVAFINRFIGGRAKVVSQYSDVDNLQLKPGMVFVLTQTSFRPDLAKGIAEYLKEKFPEPNFDFRGEVKGCPDVRQRIKEIMVRSCWLHDPKAPHENVPLEMLFKPFRYNAIVLVGSFASKQCNYIAVDLKMQVPRIVRVEGPDNLCASQFKPGYKVLVAGGPEVSASKVKRVVRKLRRLRSGQTALEGEDPGLCISCEQREYCPRWKGCPGCGMGELLSELFLRQENQGEEGDRE